MFNCAMKTTFALKYHLTAATVPLSAFLAAIVNGVYEVYWRVRCKERPPRTREQQMLHFIALLEMVLMFIYTPACTTILAVFQVRAC